MGAHHKVLHVEFLGFYPLEFRAVGPDTAHWGTELQWYCSVWQAGLIYSSSFVAGCHSAATCPAGNLSPWPSGPCSAGTSAVVLVLVLVVLLVLVGPAAITRANGYQAGSPLVKGSNHATDKLVNLCHDEVYVFFYCLVFWIVHGQLKRIQKAIQTV